MRKIVEFFKNNRIWNTVLWSCILLFLVFTLLGIQGKEQSLRISRVEIQIEPKEELAFLDSMKIMEIIRQGDSGLSIMGAEKNLLRLDRMEESLENYPFLEKADISVDLSGKLEIKVLQREPVLRIMGLYGQSYYVAKNGYKMPLHSDFYPRVLVANGLIAEKLGDSGFVSTTLTKDLLRIAAYCNADEFWRSQIEQLYVDNYMDIILIPKVGNHSIVFGSAEHLEKKFEHLKLFYFKGLNYIGWDTYKTIDLRFDGQVIGEKRNYNKIIQP